MHTYTNHVLSSSLLETTTTSRAGIEQQDLCLFNSDNHDVSGSGSPIRTSIAVVPSTSTLACTYTTGIYFMSCWCFISTAHSFIHSFIQSSRRLPLHLWHVSSAVFIHVTLPHILPLDRKSTGSPFKSIAHRCGVGRRLLGWHIAFGAELRWWCIIWATEAPRPFISWWWTGTASASASDPSICLHLLLPLMLLLLLAGPVPMPVHPKCQ